MVPHYMRERNGAFLELLTILYAMLAALTGLSVGEAAPQRQELVAAANAEAAIAAIAAVSDAALPAADHDRWRGRLLARQDALAMAPPARLSLVAPIAWVDLGRRHL
jgi:hypothetical protein